MKAYINILKLEALTNLEYRFNVLLGPVALFLSVGVNILLWHLILKTNGMTEINGMKLRDFVFYFTLANMVHQFRASWAVNFEMIQEIREGRVTRYLTRPLSFFWNYFSIWMGRQFGFFLIYTLIAIVMKFLYPHSMFQEWWQFPAFLAVMATSILISHCLYMSIVTLNFWFHDVGGMVLGFNFFSSIALGTLVPYSFYPDWAHRVLDASPFPYLVHLPIQVIQGNLPPLEIAEMWGSALLWCVVLGGVYKVLYTQAVKAYGGYGG